MKSGDRFAKRWFSDEEIAYCSSKTRLYLHNAARKAAKEAAVSWVAVTMQSPAFRVTGSVTARYTLVLLS